MKRLKSLRWRGSTAAVIAFIAAVLSVGFTGRVAAQDQDPDALPATPTTTRVLGLVDALNRGPSEIGAFVREFYDDGYSGYGSAEGLTNYWAAVSREVGPMRVEVFEPLQLGPREEDIYWIRGTTTRFWIGIRLTVSEDSLHLIQRNGVLRGVRPRAGPRADPAEAGMAPFHPELLGRYLDDWLTSAADGGQFAGSVAILKGADLVYEGGFGLANRAAGIEVTPETPFRLASVTKMFTGTAIAQLVEAGRLSYDDPLSRFIPEYPPHIGDLVTVHHLLTHTSGIEIDDDPDFNRAVRDATGMPDLLEAQLTYIERLNRGNYEDFEPLTEFDYTNEGIDLLGLIVERVSGQPWSDYLQNHVFRPAGMRRTGSHVLVTPSGLAESYSMRSPAGWLPGGPRRVADGSMVGTGRIRPAGSGWSTAGDMARFVLALRDGTLVGPETYARMTTPHIVAGQLPGEELGYGYTLNVDRRGGRRVVGHGGGAPGINTQVAWYPEEDWVVVILSNLDRAAGHTFWHVEELLGIR